MSSLSRRLDKIENALGVERVGWTLKTGRRVSFTTGEMFNAYMELQYREGEALGGEPLRELGAINRALLDAREDDRARLALDHDWTARLEHYLQRQANPDPEEQRYFRTSARPRPC